MFRPWSKKRGRRSRRGASAGLLTEIAFYLGLILVGVFTLALVIVSRLMVDRLDISLPAEARIVLESDLARGDGRWGSWITAIVGLVATVSGVGGLVYRLSQVGFSRERLSARQVTSRKNRQDDQEQYESEFQILPTVPATHPLDDSPGEHLRYRLASESSGRRRLFSLASLALVWNSVCFVLLAVVVSGWWYQRPRPILAIFLVPFFGVAIWAMRSFLQQVRRIAGVGPTLLEISEHPLCPGGSYQVHLAQMGKLRLKRLSVSLVCREESYFRQGTDVRADYHVALCQDLLVASSVRVDPQVPWVSEFTFVVPENAMHSFAAAHNAIRWRIVVSGESRPWPSFCRNFPVIVRPADQRSARNPR